MASIDATWSISLDCECPSCKEDIDLLDNPDCWESLKPIEHGTDRTTDMETFCPKCGHEFNVTLSY